MDSDSSESTYQQLKAERDKLDRENERLHEKNGDLGLDNQKLQDELEQTREEVQSLKQTLAERQAVDRTVHTEQEVHSLQPQAKKLTGFGKLPNLGEIRSRILKDVRSDKLKAVTSVLDKFIAEVEASAAPVSSRASDWDAKTDAFLADAKGVLSGES